MPYPENALLKGTGPEVYVVQGGQRRWCTTPAELAPFGGGGAVRTVPDADLQTLPIGAPVGGVPEGMLLNGRGTDPVYLLQGGRRRWVPDPPTLDTVGGWDKVVVVGQDLVNSLPLGEPYPQARQPVAWPLHDSDVWHHSWRGMRGDAYLTAQGQLRADITTESRSWLLGFVGGCDVVLIDAGENVIHHWLIHPLGVDGRKLWWRQSKRTDHPEAQVDPALAAKAVRIDMWFSHMPVDKWKAILAEVRQKAGDLWQLYSDFTAAAP